MGKKSEEVIVLEQKIQELRQQILALNEKNANIFIEYRNYKVNFPLISLIYALSSF